MLKANYCFEIANVFRTYVLHTPYAIVIYIETYPCNFIKSYIHINVIQFRTFFFFCVFFTKNALNYFRPRERFQRILKKIIIRDRSSAILYDRKSTSFSTTRLYETYIKDSANQSNMYVYK